MKCFVLTCGFVLSLLISLAAINGDSNNNLVSQNTVAELDGLETYLMSGVWTNESNNLKEIIQFSENGLAQLIRFDNHTITHYIISSWELLQNESGKDYFQLSYKKDQANKSFNLHLNGDELQMIDNQSGSRVAYTFSAPSQNYSDLLYAIEGDWQNSKMTSSNSDVHYLGYSLGQQQKYACKIQRERYCTEELGAWELSKDGNFIFLVPKDGASPYLVHIKYLEGDEMVLEYATVQSDNTISKFSSYFFNKI